MGLDSTSERALRDLIRVQSGGKMEEQDFALALSAVQTPEGLQFWNQLKAECQEAQEGRLKETLLRYGGCEVNVAPDLLPLVDFTELTGELPFAADTGLLVELGRLEPPHPFTCLQGDWDTLATHRRTAQYFYQHTDDEDLSKRVDMVTGYALEGDCWVRCTWAVSRQREGRSLFDIQERAAYYGMRLDSTEPIFQIGPVTPGMSAFDFCSYHLYT